LISTHEFFNEVRPFAARPLLSASDEFQDAHLPGNRGERRAHLIFAGKKSSSSKVNMVACASVGVAFTAISGGDMGAACRSNSPACL
jgi:hypothetical protein